MSVISNEVNVLAWDSGPCATSRFSSSYTMNWMAPWETC